MARSTVIVAEDRFTSGTPLRKSDLADTEEGTQFGWFDRMFMGWDEGKVFQYSDWEARDIAEMLKRDYKAKQLEAVLTYPTLRAQRTINPVDGGQAEHDAVVRFFGLDPDNGGMETPLDLVVDQMTSAAIYKKAFFEPSWKRGEGEFAGKSVYRRIAWRPQTVTRSLHDARSGRILGWRQEPWTVGTMRAASLDPPEGLGSRSLIHVHGMQRDPINGVSDLEVPYWAYKTKQKIIFLLCQFLESVSLPRVVVKSQDDATSRLVARSLAQAKNSGIIPVNVNGRPDSVAIDVLEMAGQGHDQFLKMISWLDSCAVNAVMAGFLELPSAAANGRGSNALSEDASDFFLMTLESKNRGYERTVTSGIFAPFVRHNFGPSAKVPRFTFEPLNAEDKSAMVTMLSDILRGRDPALVPDEFIEPLVQKVADYFGMDGKKIGEAFRGGAEKARQQAAAKSVAAASPGGQAVAGMAGAVGAATRAVVAGKKGKDPVKAAKRPAKR